VLLNHHATLYRVSDVTTTPFDIAELSKHSEIYEFSAQKFSIAEVRELITIAYGRPLEKPTRTIIVRTNDIGIEAQHALLKILEEPPETTRIIVVIEAGSVLIPTLMSRFAIFGDTSVRHTDAVAPVWQQFRVNSIPDRIELVGDVFKNKDTDRETELQRGLTEYLVGKTQASPQAVDRLLWCLNQLRVHGASRKMIWEEIALTLPVVEDVTR
jgi:hypothetical protein